MVCFLNRQISHATRRNGIPLFTSLDSLSTYSQSKEIFVHLFGDFNMPHVNEYFEMQDFLLDNRVIFMYHEYGLDS